MRFGEEHLLHGDAHQGSFLFLLQLLLIKAADEQQVRELFNDGNGIGNSTCPKSFPDFVDLTFEFACDHDRRGFGAGKIGCELRRYLGPAETIFAMALPKFNETFIPILTVLSNGKILTAAQLRNKVKAEHYAHLTEEDFEATTKQGKNLLFDRIDWGKTYLKLGGFIQQPKRGVAQINEAGIAALKSGILSLKEVKSTDAFIAHEAGRANKKQAESEDQRDETSSPQDLIDQGITAIEKQVKGELISRVKEMDPYEFEVVILKLLRKMGYGEMVTTKKSGDGGIDGVMNEDTLGLERIYIQAKRYTENKVQETDIRNFIGAMSGDTSKGVFVTTSAFSAKAVDKADSAHHRIILIDGNKLADLMYEFEVGIQVKEVYPVKELDDDFFSA